MTCADTVNRRLQMVNKGSLTVGAPKSSVMSEKSTVAGVKSQSQSVASVNDATLKKSIIAVFPSSSTMSAVAASSKV